MLVAATVMTLAFILTRLSGDLAISIAGPNATQADVEAVRKAYGLDRPCSPCSSSTGSAAPRPATWARATSSSPRVAKLIGERMPITITLGLTGLVIALLVSLPLGILAAVRENTALDRVVQMVALLGQAMPSFWLGLILMIVFGLQLGWLPISGTGSWQHFVMPGIVLAFSAIPALTRLTRAGMIQAMGSDYIRTARAKGLSRASILLQARAAQRRHPGGGDRRRPARLHAGRLDRDRAGLRPARRGLPRLGEHRQERLPRGAGGRAGAGGDLRGLTMLADLMNAVLDPRLRGP